MQYDLTSKEYVDKKTSYYNGLGFNNIGNGIRVGIINNGDKASLLIFGSHNSVSFVAYVYVYWNTSNGDISVTITNIVGECKLRYKELNSTHAIVDFVTNKYGTVAIICSNPFYSNYIPV